MLRCWTVIVRIEARLGPTKNENGGTLGLTFMTDHCDVVGTAAYNCPTTVHNSLQHAYNTPTTCIQHAYNTYNRLQRAYNVPTTAYSSLQRATTAYNLPTTWSLLDVSPQRHFRPRDFALRTSSTLTVTVRCGITAITAPPYITCVL